VFCFLFSTRDGSTGRVFVLVLFLVLVSDILEQEEEVSEDEEFRFSGLADEESEGGERSVESQLEHRDWRL
jgi:hypothetical protein